MGVEAATYCVVFEGTGEKGSNTKGVRTWTSFKDKAEYEEFLKKRTNKDVILAAGIDSEEAIDLISETTRDAYLQAALDQATDSTGRVNQALLHMYRTNAFFADYANKQRLAKKAKRTG